LFAGFKTGVWAAAVGATAMITATQSEVMRRMDVSRTRFVRGG